MTKLRGADSSGRLPVSRVGRGRVGGGRATVLVVDDSADNRDLYAEYLALRGFDVATAVDGVGALALARELRPNVIVMDLSLHGKMDGWYAIQRLKHTLETRHIPVIVLTGHAEVEARRRAYSAGCDVFLTKPCLPVHLFEEIEALLSEIPGQEG